LFTSRAAFGCGGTGFGTESGGRIFEVGKAEEVGGAGRGRALVAADLTRGGGSGDKGTADGGLHLTGGIVDKQVTDLSRFALGVSWCAGRGTDALASHAEAIESTLAVAFTLAGISFGGALAGRRTDPNRVDAHGSTGEPIGAGAVLGMAKAHTVVFS
jgi:hypothetical protein